MEDIVDLIATDASAADITDRIKDHLYARSAGRIEAMKPDIAGQSFFQDSEAEAPEESTEQEQ